ncbi:hypothetical protein EYF80_068293 [Liparis tanakae]|uniref:Uncharacterized protein n=1 Tax=Liparis tanakae TaxID=230148 RepID=A0A4Z2DYL3_9TELE|nr:hypothetical protein EYF80_068293 [Liparis tanakae]
MRKVMNDKDESPAAHETHSRTRDPGGSVPPGPVFPVQQTDGCFSSSPVAMAKGAGFSRAADCTTPQKKNTFQ